MVIQDRPAVSCDDRPGPGDPEPRLCFWVGRRVRRGPRRRQSDTRALGKVQTPCQEGEAGVGSSPSESPDPVTTTLFAKRAFADVITLKLWR